MSGPGRWDLTLYRGDSWSQGIAILDGAQQPIDLTGSVVAAQARTGSPDGPLLFDFVVTIEDPTTGVVLLSLPAGVVFNGTPVVWDLQRTTAEGLVRTLLAGNVQCVPDVTRPGEL